MVFFVGAAARGWIYVYFDNL